MRPWVILVIGAVFAGAGFGAAKVWQSLRAGPCASAPQVAAGSVTATRAVTPVRGNELEGVRESVPAGVRRDFLPADAVDTGRGAGIVRVTVLSSADEAVDGDAIAAAYGLREGNSSPVAVGDGTGRLAAGDRPVAVGALDGCTAAVVAGGSVPAVERIVTGLRSP